MPHITIERTDAINTEALDAELRQAFGPLVNGISRRPGSVIVHLHKGADSDDMALARRIVADHDPNRLTPHQQAALRRRDYRDGLREDVDLRALQGRSAADLRDFIEHRIAGWSTLADAQADLQVWLPLLMAALLASHDPD